MRFLREKCILLILSTLVYSLYFVASFPSAKAQYIGGNIAITNGAYVPPGVPISATDAEKANAPKERICCTNGNNLVSLNEYEPGYEVLWDEIDWTGGNPPGLSQDYTVTMQWFKGSTLVYATETVWTAGSQSGSIISWLAYTPGQIDGPGTYTAQCCGALGIDDTTPFVVQQSLSGYISYQSSIQVASSVATSAPSIFSGDPISIAVTVLAGIGVIAVIAIALRRRTGLSTKRVCPKCGFENRRGASYCGQCREKI